MKRILTITSLAFLAAISQAGVNFNVDVADVSVAKPASGFVLVTFSGTVDISGGFAPKDTIVEFPKNGSDTLTFDSFDAGFAAYVLAGVVDSDYTGALFSFQVKDTDAVGMYDRSDSILGSSPFSEAVFVATKSGIDASDNEYISVNVEPVPEPASMAILGIGITALVAKGRRR